MLKLTYRYDQSAVRLVVEGGQGGQERVRP